MCIILVYNALLIIEHTQSLHKAYTRHTLSLHKIGQKEGFV